MYLIKKQQILINKYKREEKEEKINRNKISTKCTKMTEEGGDSIRKNGINGVSVTSSTNSNSTLSSTTSTTITTTNNNNCNNHYSIDEFVHNKSPKRPTATTSGSGLGGGAQTPPSPSIQNLNHSTLHNHDKSPGPGVPPTSGNNKTTTSGGRLQFFKGIKHLILDYCVYRSISVPNSGTQSKSIIVNRRIN